LIQNIVEIKIALKKKGIKILKQNEGQYEISALNYHLKKASK
jgi:hypothetical protein